VGAWFEVVDGQTMKYTLLSEQVGIGGPGVDENPSKGKVPHTISGVPTT